MLCKGLNPLCTSPVSLICHADHQVLPQELIYWRPQGPLLCLMLSWHWCLQARDLLALQGAPWGAWELLEKPLRCQSCPQSPMWSL